MARLILILLLLMVGIAKGETYKGIGPLDHLQDVKNLFPKATYTRTDVAWTKESEVLFKVTGEGMAGTIVIKFDDSRPDFKRQLDEGLVAEKNIEFWKQMANQTDEEALAVSWVRWVPNSRIPLSRFVSKYGKPDDKGFDDESLQPYRTWKKGLTTYLSDDEKSVLLVDYAFTIDEQRKAWKSKYNFIPDNLKGKTKSKKRK